MTQKDASATGFSIEGNERLGWTPEAIMGLEAAEYAAIHLKVPKSGTPWLDEMIEEANRRDLAAQFMSASLASPELLHCVTSSDLLQGSASQSLKLLVLLHQK